MYKHMYVGKPCKSNPTPVFPQVPSWASDVSLLRLKCRLGCSYLVSDVNNRWEGVYWRLKINASVSLMRKTGWLIRTRIDCLRSIVGHTERSNL